MCPIKCSVSVFVLSFRHVCCSTMLSRGSEETNLGFAPNISKNTQNVNVREEDKGVEMVQ